MSTIGEMLRASREEAGLSREDLARILRLSCATVVALEEQRWEVLPQPVYIRGFVSSWCRVTSLDDALARDALIRALDISPDDGGRLPSLPDGPGIMVGVRTVKHSRRPRFVLWAILLAGVVLGVALALALRIDDEPQARTSESVQSPLDSGDGR